MGNPWEDEEWEGLTAAEKYEMMKNELVPAQQARLSKLCISDLEKQLEESKNSLTSALIEKENLKTDIKKLEAKLCFQDSSSSAPTSEDCNMSASNIVAPPKMRQKTKVADILPTLSKRKVKPTKSTTGTTTEVTEKKPSTLIAPAKFIENPQAKSSDNSRRRSARSASSLANFKITETLSPDLNEVQKRSRSKADPDTSLRAKKSKKPDSEEPTSEDNVEGGSKTEDREPLGRVTNSPCKKPSRTRVAKNVQKRNPEECKQQ